MGTPCNDPVAVNNDPVLAALCSCEEATSSLTDATDAYTAELANFTSDNAEYRKYEAYEACRTQGSCTNYDSIYGTTYQSEYNAYKNELRGMINCFQPFESDKYTSDEFCRRDAGLGWVYSKNQNAGISKPPCNDTARPTTTSCADCDLNQIRGYCQRSNSQLFSDWDNYFSANATRPTVSTAPIPPSFNPQVAITCCAQTLTDFKANRINIGQVTQNCSAEISTNLSSYEETGAVPPSLDNGPPDNPQAPAGLQTFAIVLIIAAVLVFIAMMIWVGVRLRKRNAGKSSSEEGATSPASEGRRATPPASEGRRATPPA